MEDREPRCARSRDNPLALKVNIDIYLQTRFRKLVAREDAVFELDSKTRVELQRNACISMLYQWTYSHIKGSTQPYSRRFNAEALPRQLWPHIGSSCQLGQSD